MEVKEIGLYIHIPFCRQKCYYCDFVSFANRDDMIERYVNCVKQEIIQYAQENKVMSDHNLEPKYILKTIYIGGGTPSAIPERYIVEILETVKENFEIKDDAEITIEVNPGTVNEEKLKIYKKIGINRLSIGLQSTDNNMLKQIGRIHSYEEFLTTYKLARSVGFDNINVDLMIGLPNQKVSHIKNSLEKIVGLKPVEPEHISVYSLIVEDNTPIEKMLNTGKLKLPDEEIERNMYWYVKNFLELNGYKHYEISNFAKKVMSQNTI